MKLLLCLLCSCLFSLCTFCAQAQDQDPLSQARALTLAGDPDAAQVLLQREMDGSSVLNLQSARWRLELASLIEPKGQFKLAAKYLHEAIGVFEATPGLPPELLPAALHNLAVAQVSLAQWKDAEISFLRAIALFEVHFGKHHVYLHKPLENLALLQIELGRISEASAFLKRSHELRLEFLSGDANAEIMDLMALGRLDFALARYDLAVKKLEKARDLAKRSPGARSGLLAGSLSLLANAYFCSRNFARAESAWLQALTIREAANDVLTYTTALETAQILLFRKDWNAAMQLVKRYLPQIASTLGEGHTAFAHALDLQGRAQRGLENYQEAERLFRESLQLYEKATGPQSRQVGYLRHDLGLLYLDWGRPKEARSELEVAVAAAEVALGPTHPDLALYLFEYARCLRLLGDHKAARAASKRSQNIMAANASGDSAHIVDFSTLKLTH